MHHKNLRGILYCLFAVLAWGGMFPIMGSALKVVNPFAFTAIRYTAAGLCFLLALYLREGRAALKVERPATVWVLGSLGFAGFGFLVFLGQKLAGPAGTINASVMMALMPMLSVILNRVFRGVRPLKYTPLFILMSFVGVICVATRGHLSSLASLQGNLLADTLILLGAACWVTYTIGVSSFRGWSPLRYTALTTGFGVPTIWAVNFALHLVGLNHCPTGADVLSVAPHLLYMVLVAGFLAVLAWNSGNRILTPINGVLFMDVVPMTTFVISALGGYAFNNAELLGATLTLSALIINNVYQRRATASAAMPQQGQAGAAKSKLTPVASSS